MSRLRSVLPWLSGLALASSAFPAGAVTLFHETLDGYTSFPNQEPSGDPINRGRPRVVEGADEEWIGARFELSDGGTFEMDLAVQKFGGAGNSSPVARVEDDLGLVLKLDLTDYVDVELSFIWRTFLTDTTDRLVVMYHVGDGLGDPGNNYDWFSDPSLGNGQMVDDGCPGTTQCVNPWVRDNWTELMRDRDNNSFHPESFSLPGGDVIYVAFYMDNGEGDYAKIDDVLVTGTLVPEPSTGLLVGLGLAALTVRRRRQSC